MCNNSNTTTMIKKQPTSRRKPAARRTRKKPKFLSLKKELSPSPSPPGSSGDAEVPVTKQLDLFPLHPENLMEEKDENVDHLLDSGGGATLTGLLNAAEKDAPPSGYAYRGQESENCGDAIMRSAWLVRTAMKRRKETHVSEEKWVHYSEVVEKKEEEVSSCSDGLPWTRTTARSLSLKLDYQEILDAWSDKGSLFIGGDHCPQTVPDLRDDDFFGSAHDCAYNNYGVTEGLGSVGNLWTVPENSGSITGSSAKTEEGGKESCSKREASVLRYKEKRQNRLFSKQIRYQVRKLNAEKRPRMKGRFVKRN